MTSYRCMTIMAVLALTPLSSLASEDSAPYFVGGEVNYEISMGNAFLTPEGLPDKTAFLPQEKIDESPSGEMSLMDGSAEADMPPFSFDAPDVGNNIPMLQAAPTAPEPEPEPEPEQEEKPLPRIDKNQALTDTLKKDPIPTSSGLGIPKIEGTWVDKLASSNPLSLLEGSEDDALYGKTSSSKGLEDMVDKARVSKNRRSNASVFDISGVMLRMSLSQVEETLKNRGFRKMMEKFQIPNFIKWRNEEICRNSGVVGYERTEACVTQKAKKEKHEYLQVAKYAKFDTKEEIEVTFTSNFTDNKVYKIMYKSMAASNIGNSPKAVYLRNIKVYDFWKKINQKYGKPDNKNNVTWGMGGNKPYMKAQTGFLLLEDPMLRELDYTRMSREDQRYMNTDLYSF